MMIAVGGHRSTEAVVMIVVDAVETGGVIAVETGAETGVVIAVAAMAATRVKPAGTENHARKATSARTDALRTIPTDLETPRGLTVRCFWFFGGRFTSGSGDGTNG